MPTEKKSSSESRFRRRAHCTICKHPEREDIDREFVSWARPEAIVAEFKLGSRFALYRHAHATELFLRRGRNLPMALGRLIERIDAVPATAGAIVSAIALYATEFAQRTYSERSVYRCKYASHEDVS